MLVGRRYRRPTYTASQYARQHANPLKRTEPAKAAVAAYIVFAITLPQQGINGFEGIGLGCAQVTEHDTVVRGATPG